MDNYNNDYNKDLYTAQSEDFCKSCYSSSKSRAGCLWALVAALAVFVVFKLIESATNATVAVFVTVLLLFAAVAGKIINRKRNS